MRCIYLALGNCQWGKNIGQTKFSITFFHYIFMAGLLYSQSSLHCFILYMIYTYIISELLKESECNTKKTAILAYRIMSWWLLTCQVPLDKSPATCYSTLGGHLVPWQVASIYDRSPCFLYFGLIVFHCPLTSTLIIYIIVNCNVHVPMYIT